MIPPATILGPRRRIVVVLGAYAAIAGFVSFLAWAADVPGLADWDGNGIAIQPNTTVAATAAGAALVLLAFGRGTAAAGVGALTGLIGATALFEHLSGVDVGVDAWLLFGRSWGQLGTLAPGRMGVAGSIAWTLIGLGLLLTRRGAKARQAASILGMVAALISVLSLVGYLFRADTLYALPRLTIIALQTSTMVFASGIALVAALADVQPGRLLLADSAGGLLARRALPITVVLPVVLGWVELEGERAGLYDPAMGSALLVLALVMVLLALVWWGAMAVGARERALRAGEERLRLALDVGRVGTWNVELRSGDVTWSPGSFALLGVDASSTPASIEIWEQAIHPEDRARVMAAWRASLAGGTPYDAEYRVLWPSGEVRSLHARGRVLRDERGRPVRDVGALVDVTDLKRVTEAEARLAAHAENSPLAIVEWNADYRVVRWSGEAERLFGWTAAEVIGKRIDEFPIVYEEDVPVVDDVMRAMDAATAIRNVSFNRNRRKDGAVVHCAWYNSALFDATGTKVSVYSQVLDRTKEVEALAALHERERTLERQTADLRTMLDIIPIGVGISHDPRGDRISVNSSFARLLRIEDGQNASLTGPGRERIPYRCLRDGAEIPGDELPMQVASRTGQSLRDVEFDIVFADGEVIHLLVNAAPLFAEDGRVRGAIGAHVDVTALKKAELALRDADRRKDEFLAMLAHELRNPLAPVRNAVQVVRALAPSEPRLQRARELIDRQVTHMTRLIDDLLDVSRITSGKITLKRAVVSLTELIEEAVESTRPAIEQQQHTLAVTLGTDPLLIDADRARIVQVIGNLLANAAKFTPRGGHITVVAARTETGAAAVQVRDTGIGIPKERQDEVFELFRQEETSLARSQGGLGIGLTLVRRLVELHRGSVRVQSEGRGRGTEFTVVLPALPSKPTAVPAHPPPQASAASGALRVLVVEDNADAAESFEMLLDLAGHEVRVAPSALDALRLLDDFTPIIAFVDLGLPGMSGFELAGRLRADPRSRDAVLVAVTGYGRDEDKEEARRAGFDHHMTKPVDIDAVWTLLSSLASRRSPASRVSTLGR